MGFPLTKGSEVTKADLDLLATLANAKLVNSMQDMGRTSDLLRVNEPGYTSGTMTGSFSFSTPTEIWPTPLGHPSAQAFERWSWLDELNRIWACLWNITVPVVSGIPLQPAGNGGWDTYESPVYNPLSVALAVQRIEDYWHPAATYPTRGADTEYNGSKIVASPGPDCWLQVAGSGQDLAFYYYRYARALYTREQDDFGIYTGIWVNGTQTITGDGAHHDSSDPIAVTFYFNDLDSANLYGSIVHEFARTSGTADPIPGDYDTDLVSTGGGYGTIGSPSGGGAVFEQDGDRCWVFTGSATKDGPLGYITGDFNGSGDQTLRSYLNTTGWVWVKTTFRGGFVNAPKNLTDGAYNSGGDKVIHPRNVSVKVALHDLLYNSPLLVESDILNFDSTVAPYGMELHLGRPGMGVRSVDNFLRGFLSDTTRDLLDDDIFNAPPGDSAPALTALVADLNDRIILYPARIYSEPEWSDVALRPGTQWLLDLDPVDPEMLSRLNRLLLEDAYPTQIRRIPVTRVAPEAEIYELQLPDPAGMASFEGVQMLACHKCTNPDAKIIYLADSLPQWSYNTCLDMAMPNTWSYLGPYSTGPQAFFQDPLFGEGGPVCNPVPSLWPVFRTDIFGVPLVINASQDGSTTPPTPTTHVSAYTPFWDSDARHLWSRFPAATLAAGAESYRSFQIESTDAQWRYEFSAKNRELVVYASTTGYPDPADPSTYFFRAVNGYFIFPDDFTAAGLLADAYKGSTLYLTCHNPTTRTLNYRVEISTFKPADGEYPPETAPNFFPDYETNNNQSSGNIGDFRIYGESRIFSIVKPDYPHPENLNLPCPPRGHMIRELQIRRPRVLNAAGLYVAPTDTAPAGFLHVGIMAGAGVIAGAVNGCYPGDFVEFLLVAVPTGDETDIVKVMFPVLEAAPLAYYARTVDGDHDIELEITASVEFQPGINNTFVRTDGGTYPVTGAFNGPPFMSNTWGWHLNYNSPQASTIDHWSWLGPSHRYDANDVMPPISAESINELYNFMNGMTVLP